MTADSFAAFNTVAACDIPARIEFVHPVTKKGMGQGVFLVGKDSAIFNRLVEEAADADRQRGFTFTRKGKAIEPKTLAEDRAASIALIAGCTTGFWCNAIEANKVDEIEPREGGDFMWIGNEKLTFSRKNVFGFYTNYPEGFRQANEAIADLENFIKD